MDELRTLRTLPIADRGKIACRLIRTAKKLGVRTLAVYSASDSASQHVVAADEAHPLRGEPRAAYLNGEQIIAIARDRGAQAIVPGYGFLAEDAAFARSVAAAGIVFAGSSPEAIEACGRKHTARELAARAGVPVVPGSDGLLDSDDAAAAAAAQLGYPVMLKATAGGGGMGLLACRDEAELRSGFDAVRSRAAALFDDPGVLLERHLPDCRHVEVQVFGNGLGRAVALGERECSVQRRHQKVVEECPSPRVAQTPGLRERLMASAVQLAESIGYGSVGTVEFLVDDPSGDFFLDSFTASTPGIDVLAGGSYTLVQDYSGRPTVGHCFGHAGPMGPVAFQAANLLVGNAAGTEGLEITLTGPDLAFLGDAVVALCGPPVPARLDGAHFPQWTRRLVRAGQRLTVGQLAAHCRVYLAVYGGFANVAAWFGSKATNPMVNVGGYQGRPLRAGDFLRTVGASELPPGAGDVAVPRQLLPVYAADWVLQVTPGPYETGYLSGADIETLYGQACEVSHNAARGGIRLVGPRPGFARRDGGDGGSHPSNVIEYGYPVGGLNLTGDEPVIFPVDCPDFGGFVCSLTVKADLWKVGQLRAGDRVRFRSVDLEHALDQRRGHDDFLRRLASAVASGSWDDAVPFDGATLGPETAGPGRDLVWALEATASRPTVSYRAGGDDYLLVDYGDGRFDLNYKCRATALQRLIGSATSLVSTGDGAVLQMVGSGNSLAIVYDGLRLLREALVACLASMEEALGDMQSVKLPNRRLRLPVTFSHRKLVDAVERYVASQRSTASYLPDPLRFVAELKGLVLGLESVVVGVGFFMALPLCLPADPRHRLRSPKMNPSRTYTPAGTLGWGGSSLAIYNVDSPGGFMPLGMTTPLLDLFGAKPGFSRARPWLVGSMDTLRFYEVSAGEYDAMERFRAGTYRFRADDGVFDLAAHNRLLRETAAEAEALQRTRAAAQEAMARREKDMLLRWLADKDAGRARFDCAAALRQDPGLEAVEAPINANVWKVLVHEGQRVEAVKMEVNVLVGDKLAGATVAKLLIEPGDGIQGGKPVMLVKKQVKKQVPN